MTARRGSLSKQGLAAGDDITFTGAVDFDGRPLGKLVNIIGADGTLVGFNLIHGTETQYRIATTLSGGFCIEVFKDGLSEGQALGFASETGAITFSKNMTAGPGVRLTFKDPPSEIPWETLDSASGRGFAPIWPDPAGFTASRTLAFVMPDANTIITLTGSPTLVAGTMVTLLGTETLENKTLKIPFTIEGASQDYDFLSTGLEMSMKGALVGGTFFGLHGEAGDATQIIEQNLFGRSSVVGTAPLVDLEALKIRWDPVVGDYVIRTDSRGVGLTRRIRMGVETIDDMIVLSGTGVGLRETGGTVMEIGAVATTEIFQRIGATIVGVTLPIALNNNFIFSFDTTTQGISVADTFQTLTFDTNESTFDGWTHVAGTGVFVCNKAGSYDITLRSKWSKSGGGTASYGIRALFDGAEIAGSMDGEQIVTNNQIVGLNPNFPVDGVVGKNLVIQVVGSTTNLSIVPAPNPGSATTAVSAAITITRRS